MRGQINEDRQHRALLLSRRLKEIAAERDALVFRLEDLERQAKSDQLELSALHNLDVPISALPNEMLAMVFEVGALLEDRKDHFGTLVSHVAHHWRHVALATPQLWNEISFQRIERVLSFLSRSRASPIDISMTHLHGDEVSQEMRSLINDHMGHCRRLCITDVDSEALEKVIRCLSTKAAPLLRSINIAASGYNGMVKFLAPLFSFGAPHLRTAQLGKFDASTLHFCVPALRTITALRLTDIIICNGDEAAYRSFRDALMALPFLNHLELRPDAFRSTQPRLPIVLPTIQFLQLTLPLPPAVFILSSIPFRQQLW